MKFDYIIIGAGSAGCALANRLSADAQTRVLLLAAGSPDTKQEIRIPAAFGGNPNAVVIMVAEKAADIIKNG